MSMLISFSGLSKLYPSTLQLIKLLVERAETFAVSMGLASLIATNGFIDRWKKRCSIGMKQVSGEEKSVSEEVI